jgi:ligand-binding SRPBCC domain-containing protein
MRASVHDPIVDSIPVRAPIGRCFALSTRIELVQRTLGMQLAGGVTSGHVTAGSRVVWRGWKFGLLTEHHTLITAFATPYRDADGRLVAYFDDSQERGRFASFRHEHLFLQQEDETVLEDRIHFALPFGVLGRIAARLLLAPHIRRLARQRFATIKELAEGEGWREWVTE